jgi:hypothetical protein
MSNQLSLSFPKRPKASLDPSFDRRRRVTARKRSTGRRNVVYEYQYTFDKNGRRALVGLTFEETTEFELEAQPPTGSAELRWIELFSKHDHAREKDGKIVRAT